MESYAVIPDFEEFGVHAFVTTRAAGTFNAMSTEPAAAVMPRWYALIDFLAQWTDRLATARQTHGTAVAEHGPGWRGWLRLPDADGHFAAERGTAMAITVADCVPVFVVHPSGAAAAIHAGWRGTEGGILAEGIRLFTARGLAAGELRVHLGPAICGNCYEVGPDVYRRLTGQAVESPAPVDLRAILADQARAVGVRRIETSAWCTRCHNERFYSHRCGDPGRQLGALVAA